jgi:hypothetical protein
LLRAALSPANFARLLRWLANALRIALPFAGSVAYIFAAWWANKEQSRGFDMSCPGLMQAMNGPATALAYR